jgi:7-cyano-7-deazaguanine synthase
MRKLDTDAALVLFSGGQDSAIALAFALDRYARVETVGFDYGQRHAVELKARETLRRELAAAFPRWGAKLGPDRLLSLPVFGEIGGSAMIEASEILLSETGLPTTFVPGRNLAFFVLAASLAYRRDIGVLVGGMCEADFSGYPDCRSTALGAQLAALRLGMDADFHLETPLMAMTKGQSWRFAEEIGGRALVEIVREHSHSCYLGERGARRDFGYGCGTCPACDLRAKGWRDYQSAAS